MEKNFAQAVQATKAGRKLEARRLLAEIIKNDPRHAQAWYVLSFVVDKREQKIDCLQHVLRYAPDHHRAQLLLHKLEAVLLPQTQPVLHEPDNTAEKPVSTKQINLKPQVPQEAPQNEGHHSTILNSTRPIPAVRKPSPLKPLSTAKYSRCLWQLDDKDASDQYEAPDILQFLVDDIARLPIITNPHQELWLGVQLQATVRLARLIQDWESQPDTTQYTFSLYQALLTAWESLEQQCVAQELQIPKLELWISELLTARKDVYALHRSRLRRFIRRVQAISEKGGAEKFLELVYQTVEILAVLPGETLTQLVTLANNYQRLPKAEEIVIYFPATLDNLQQRVNNRVKQTQQILATGYLRYAMRIAQGHVGQGVDYADLVQAGFVGLLRAASKFDYRVQARFGTYATSWIWQAVGREIADQGRTIRLPVHVQEKLRKWEVAFHQFDNGCHNPVINPDILFQAGLLEQGLYDQIQEKGLRWGTSLPVKMMAQYEKAVEEARRLHSYSVRVASFSEIRVGNTLDRDFDDVESAVELLPNGSSLLDEVDLGFVRSVIEEQVFSFLSQKEQEILELRCGWRDGQEQTLEEIGIYHGLTRERIRQIEAKALRKLENRLALGLLPDKVDLIYEDKTPLSWQKPPIVLPVLVVADGQGDSRQGRLDILLSQLPRSSWHERRTGVQDGQRRQQLIMALEQLATPAHISDITEQLNGLVEGKELEDAHVYNLLIRDEGTFILLGQGIFSLTAWEQARTKEKKPVLPCCPMPLPDPPDYEDAFFESVLVGQQTLTGELTAVQFLHHMLNWAKAEAEPQNWFLQTLLSAYYLVDLIPYVFYFGGENPVLQCTLPATSIQELRYHCLKSLTERLVAMPEFWWLLQQRQPARPTDLGELFADMHPYGLDDVLQRLRLLASLGAAQKLKYGEYRLTSLGEECANRWKREVVMETAVDDGFNGPNFEDNFANFITW